MKGREDGKGIRDVNHLTLDNSLGIYSTTLTDAKSYKTKGQSNSFS